MTSPTGPATDRPPLITLLPMDLDIIAKLLPRVQITIGDIPQIAGTLRRVSDAHKSGKMFREVLDEKAEG